MNPPPATVPKNHFSTAAVLLYVGCLALFIAIFLHAWVTEDAYISFRVVDNFIHGHGLRWNIDERVQVYTNPLWLLLHIPFYALFGHIFIVTLALSFLCSIITVFLAISIFPKRPFLAFSAFIFPFLLSKALLEYSTSGLENPLSFLFFILFCFILFRKQTENIPWFSLSLITALAAWNRLDNIIVYAPIMTYLIVSHIKQVQWGKLALGTAPLVVWELFSLIYYGFLFPNTKYAKLHTGISQSDYFLQGLYYICDFLLKDTVSACLVILGIALGIMHLIYAALTPKDRNTGILASIGISLLLYCIYVVTVGGDFMSGRFWTMPILMSAFLLYATLSLKKASWQIGGLVILCLLGIRIDWHYHIEPELPNTLLSGIADEWHFYYETNTLVQFNQSLSLRSAIENQGAGFRIYPFGETVDHHPVIVMGNIGMYGYYHPNELIIDYNALTDPLLARLPITDTKHWRIGHFERPIPEGYVHARKTGSTEMMAPALADYYQQLREVTSGPLFSVKRFHAIAELNLHNPPEF